MHHYLTFYAPYPTIFELVVETIEYVYNYGGIIYITGDVRKRIYGRSRKMRGGGYFDPYFASFLFIFNLLRVHRALTQNQNEKGRRSAHNFP